MKRLSCTVWMACLEIAVFAAGQPEAPRAFLDEFCVGCHDRASHKAGLNLEDLAFEPGVVANERLWISVYDRIRDGSMPPEKAEQPAASERAALLRTLGGTLHDASLQRQTAVGRVPLRRLNRTQFEDTLRDLLSLPALEVKELLPEDSLVGGFDNLSNAQNTSGTHLVRYQQAVDKALAAALPTRTFQAVHVDLTGQQIFENPAKRELFTHWKCWLKEDALVIPSKLYRPFLTIANSPVPVDGRYRFRVTGRGHLTDGATLPITFNHQLSPQLAYGKDLAWRDLPADRSATVEVFLNLRQGQVVDVIGWTLPERDFVRTKLKDAPAESWTGAGFILERLEIDGPLDTWPPQSYRTLFGDLSLLSSAESQAASHPKTPLKPREKRTAEEWRRDPLAPRSNDPSADAERLIRALLPRAFRRPVADATVKHYLGVVAKLREEGGSFEEALLDTYKSVLCSTSFLFFNEKPGRLDDYALASRLSYFLWNSMPDAQLLERAAAGELSNADLLRAEVERLLADPKSERFIQQFAGQWLDLHKIEATTPDMKLYPEFDRILMESSLSETNLFFEEVLRNDRSVLEFVHSDWTYLNRRLAQHYGVGGDKPLGYELEKVLLPPDSHRGGVITQASVLKVTANGASTSPILRGKWICERILGIEPPPPPKDVPAVEPDTRGTTTIRQQLAKHRSTEACIGCHALIDPPGFALESYDVIGGWREFYRASQPTGKTALLPNYNNRRVNRGPDVEIGDRLPDGRPFADVEEYKRLILGDPDAIARSLVRRMLMFATGGDIQFADREVIEDIIARLRDKQYGLRSLIHEVVQSRPFQIK